MQGEDPRDVVDREREAAGLSRLDRGPEPKYSMTGEELQGFLSRQRLIDELMEKLDHDRLLIEALVVGQTQAIQLALARRSVPPETIYRANLDTGTFELAPTDPPSD